MHFGQTQTCTEVTNLKTKEIMKKIYSSMLAYMKQATKLGWNICNLKVAVYVPWFALLSLVKNNYNWFKPIRYECCRTFTWQIWITYANMIFKINSVKKWIHSNRKLPNEFISTRKFSITVCYTMSRPN